jgi:ubiquinone/menaquinone biosynthesis C-methylase UbiE
MERVTTIEFVKPHFGTRIMSETSENPVFNLAMAYQDTAALIAAVKLNIFTLIGSATVSLDDLVSSTGASRRGLRILCDYLTVLGLLKKNESLYSLAPVSRTFLDEASPFARGGIVDFVAAPEMVELLCQDPASYVRKGGSVKLANTSPDNQVWVRYAKSMIPFAAANAKRIASHIAGLPDPPYTVLDIAAGHGLYGIEVAKAIPEALVTAVDWAPVLTVASSNAEAAGVADRFRMLPGNAMDLEWGADFDLILLPNFLHHFDVEACTSLLRKVRVSLSPIGQAVGVEFVPNEDRVSPPMAAKFAFWMLATTPGGDAYTTSDLDQMARNAGFSGAKTYPLTPAPESMIIFEN